MVHLILAVEIVDCEHIFTIDEMVTEATAWVDVQLLTVQATAQVDVHGGCESAGVNLPWSEMLPRREIVFQPLHPETGPSLPKVRFVFGFTVLSLFDEPQSASDGIWNMLFSSVRCLG